MWQPRKDEIPPVSNKGTSNAYYFPKDIRRRRWIVIIRAREKFG
jgi:hypothetical protein